MSHRALGVSGISSTVIRLKTYLFLSALLRNRQWLWAGVILSVALSGAWAAPVSDEAALLRLTHEFERTLEGAGDRPALGVLLHPNYTYTGPDLPAAKLKQADRVIRRIALGGGPSHEVVVRLTGPVAVVTGSYSAAQALARPRFLVHGRFTMTWVQVDGQWQLLAEHRSLNDELEWASLAAKQPVAVMDKSEIFAATIERREEGYTETQAQRGSLPRKIGRLFRPYEATQIGYTFDEGDDAFMDFKFSTMFPLYHQGYPDPIRRSTGEKFWRSAGFTGPNVYAAATVRAGQYIETRPSSPVVAKRFNPLLAVRFWSTNQAGPESEENFLEFVYGHESNGQFIASRERFEEQLQVYLNQAHDASSPTSATIAEKTAYRSTRDNISRGWDYVGLQFARDWDADLSWAPESKLSFRARLNYFLPKGALQGPAEEYNAWEGDPEGKQRRRVDGLTFRYALTVATPRGNAPLVGWERFLQFERRYVMIWTTGYEDPFRYNTIRLEAGLKLAGLPLMAWYRYGYNSDLIDYYRRDHSAGLMLSFWNF